MGAAVIGAFRCGNMERAGWEQHRRALLGINEITAITRYGPIAYVVVRGAFRCGKMERSGQRHWCLEE